MFFSQYFHINSKKITHYSPDIEIRYMVGIGEKFPTIYIIYREKPGNGVIDIPKIG